MNDLTDERNAAVDRWLAEQHHTAVAEIADALDIESGLREILIPVHHDNYLTEVAEALDVEAGLAAIVPAPVRQLPPSGWAEGPGADRFIKAAAVVTRVFSGWKALAPDVRWTLREMFLSGGLTRAGELAELFQHRILSHMDADPRVRAARFVDLEYELWHAMLQSTQEFSQHSERIYVALELDAYTDADSPRMTATIERVLSALAGMRRLALNLRGQGRRLHKEFLQRHDSYDTATELHEVLLRSLRLSERMIDACNAINDFAGDDLSRMDLRLNQLGGVRWSVQTKWPESLRDAVVRDSILIGNGVFQVREGGSLHPSIA
ncbi:hypothetical protein [Nocardia iowensis]|uniref:Alpha-E domain-containing protein n=1 Tax=Nocardia iowensis TaxID=204891 RepID=A0ABX8RYH9_NOCIO|nr:hypothetical protein [Nocardia iowensis]QXN94724.1 hypothetical protein KV110_17740 [Nocardia iowensis]